MVVDSDGTLFSINSSIDNFVKSLSLRSVSTDTRIMDNISIGKYLAGRIWNNLLFLLIYLFE